MCTLICALAWKRWVWSVRVDAAGNLRGVWQPEGASGKRLIIGSHIDTVPDAGAYDGVLGVMLALELVSISQEDGIALSASK